MSDDNDEAVTMEKVPLVEQIAWAESEAERLEIWQRVLKDEGKRLAPSSARALLCAKRAAETLELVRAHEKQFVAIVMADREAHRRSIARRSTGS